jgi:hypothetical protein
MAINYQQRMFGQVNGPLADKLQGRVQRRGLVVAATIAMAGLAALTPQVVDHYWLVAVVGSVFWVLAALLNLSLHGMFELKDEMLDEYQIAERNSAYKSAYGFALVFLVVVATTAAGAAVDRLVAFGIAAFAFYFCAMAPRLLLAWNLGNENGQQ